MTTETERLTFEELVVPDRVLRFVRAMVDRQVDFDILYFLEKPWKWTDEYRSWLSFGCPSGADDEGWEQFAGGEPS